MTVNASTFRLVAGVLGVALLGLIAAIAVLAGLHDDIPTILENLATGALTALAALLVSPHSGDDPVPVQVTDQPVAVTQKMTTARRRRTDAGVSAVSVIVAVLLVLIAISLGAAVHPLWLLLIVVAIVVVLL